MTRLLLAGVLAAGGLFAAPAANADCDLNECCIYTHDGGWCAPKPPSTHEINPVCICPYDGCWCIPDEG